jgi:30S ribosomal protein S31
MGKGDGRSRRGKIFKGSYGKTRPHDPTGKTGTPAVAPPPRPAAVKKAPTPRAPRKTRDS